MRRIVGAFLLFGCGGGGGGGDDTDAATGGLDAAGGGPADAAVADPRSALAEYCARRATALCDRAFTCLAMNPGAIRSVLGLPGADVPGCAEGERTACEADVLERFDRGTARVPATVPEIVAATDQCVDQLGRTPCVGGDPNDWVSDWNKRVHSVCAGVAPGTALDDGACERPTDCATAGNLCVEGRCRAPTADDLMVECDAAGAQPGALNADATCAGRACVQVGENAEEKTGLCTVDCETGLGCPGGAYCLQLRVGNDPPTFFCTAPCTRDRDCEGGFACVPVQEDDPRKHCWVNPPPED